MRIKYSRIFSRAKILVILFLVFLVASIMVVSVGAAQWVRNGNFEAGEEGWTRAVIDNTVNHTPGGTKSVRFGSSDKEPASNDTYQVAKRWPGVPIEAIEIVPGATYELTYWIKGKDAVLVNRASSYIRWSRYDPPYTVFGAWMGPVSKNGTYDWTEVTLRITANSNPLSTRAALGFDYKGTTGNVWIDDVSLYRVDPPEVVIPKLENIVRNYPNYEKEITRAASDPEFKDQTVTLKKQWESVIGACNKKKVPPVAVLEAADTLLERSENLKVKFLMKELMR